MAIEFRDQLQAEWERVGPLCAGMDADLSRIPEHIRAGALYEKPRFYRQSRFLEEFADAVASYVSCWKPNIAFFEGHPDGQEALEHIVDYLHRHHCGKPVIGDMKRNDIGKTNIHYAKAAFDRYGFDAVTTTPYFGGDTFPPFLEFEGKGLIIMSKTSNPGSGELQDLPIYLPKALERGQITPEEYDRIMEIIPDGGDPTLDVYEMVAFLAANRWSRYKNGRNIGLVVGATYPESFGPVRKIVGDMPILIPGVGSTQGGDFEKVLRFAPNARGQGMIINIGSEALFASKEKDFADAAAKVFRGYHQRYTDFRSETA